MQPTSDSQRYPKISVILVTLNAADVLQKCLNSIYRQGYPNIELLIIDGGSNDGTIDILKKNDNSIGFWKSESDNGIYDAMNKALNNTTGEWVYFLGADDELFEEFSSLAYELKDPGIIYYGSVLKNGIKYLGKLDAYKHAKLTICHQAMIYPRSVFEKYRFDTCYKISADHVLNMWLWKDEKYRFEFKDYIIAKFNHTGISAGNPDILFNKEKSSLILKHYGLIIWIRYQFKRIKGKILKQ